MEFLYFNENSWPLVQNTCDRFSIWYFTLSEDIENTNQALEQSVNINNYYYIIIIIISFPVSISLKYMQPVEVINTPLKSF
jgi:hypothetical protein